MKNRAFIPVIAIAFSTLVSASAQAKEVKYKDFNLELHEGDRLSITALRGSIKLTPTGKALVKATGENVQPAEGAPGNGSIRVRKAAGVGPALEAFEQWTFSVRREGNIVRVEAKGPDNKGDWETQLRSGVPDLHFEIDAPAVPVEAALREGSITATGWKNSLVLQVIEGKITASKNEGMLKAQAQRGEIKIDNQKGRTEADGFNPKIAITAQEGELFVDNFSGESNVQGVKGHLQTTSFSGQTNVTKVEGGADFQVGRGTLHLTDLTGALRGKLDNGSVVAKLNGEPEVNIESQEGGVSLDLPNGASPNVRLQTEDGNLVAPGELAQSKAGGQKILAGRLGGGGNGSVIVKTKSGNVRLF
jgi:hypothetical protein